MKKRLTISLITGGLLGCVCIIGASIRAGGLAGNEIYLIALWYNRVIIGVTIGLADNIHTTKLSYDRYIRSGFIALLMSGAFFLSTEFRDYIAFIAGMFYGLIIEFFAYKYSK